MAESRRPGRGLPSTLFLGILDSPPGVTTPSRPLFFCHLLLLSDSGQKGCALGGVRCLPCEFWQPLRACPSLLGTQDPALAAALQVGAHPTVVMLPWPASPCTRPGACAHKPLCEAEAPLGSPLVILTYQGDVWGGEFLYPLAFAQRCIVRLLSSNLRSHHASPACPTGSFLAQALLLPGVPPPCPSRWPS